MTPKLTLVSYSGLLALEFENVSEIGHKADALRDKIAAHPSCELAFIAACGDGVNVVFRLDTTGLDTSDADAVQAFHGRAFACLQAECEDRYGVKASPTGKELARPISLAHDADAYYNGATAPFRVPR